MTDQEFLSKLSTESFWDTDLGRLDPRRYARFIIRRVMERGTREEVRAVNAYFTREEVADALLSARSLDPKTIAYFSAILQIPRERFRAHHGMSFSVRELPC